MKKTTWLLLLVTLCPFGLPTNLDLRSEAEPSPQPHRSPIDLVLLPDGRHALTANHTSDSVSLIDLVDGKVGVERACGRKPVAIACSADGQRVAVSNLWDGTLSLFEYKAKSLRPLATVQVGSQPRGLAFAPDGGSLYIALAGAHEIAKLDWNTRKVTSRWSAPSEPRLVALTPDGKHLAACSSRSADVRCWDTTTSKLVWREHIFGAFNLHGLAVTPDGQDVLVSYVHNRETALTRNNISEGWALNSRIAKFHVTPKKNIDYKMIGLDTRGEAVGDPNALTFTSKGDRMILAAGGTHEVIVLATKSLFWNSGDAGDFLDGDLLIDENKFRRIPLGGRPIAVKMLDDTRVAVANYFQDSVQVVDITNGKCLREISLGSPATPSLARKGEAIFHDAKRSHHQWFSCNTCHPDGHTSSASFDTLNDDSYGNPKLTPTLRGVHRTGPYTWHGWQDRLRDAVDKSLTDTLFGPEPSKNDVDAVLAYMRKLEHPPNPYRQADGSLSPAAERGKHLFANKANCIRCHDGAEYTSGVNLKMKIPADGSEFELWNPPSLRGVVDRGPYLHNARAPTLEVLLRSYHVPEKLGGEALSDEERRDLIAFLKSL